MGIVRSYDIITPPCTIGCLAMPTYLNLFQSDEVLTTFLHDADTRSGIAEYALRTDRDARIVIFQLRSHGEALP